ncbi:MAG: T9SS type A sorting domain-containing protein [Flavobacteriales bacterium]|nr:T9SS type A sorting domain-containing protein [Flavobacteriales bacterium]
MKKTYSLFLLLFISFSFAQTTETEMESMVEAEMKAASNVMSFVVNPNTLNYDLTHAELRLSVDPADYFVAGTVKNTVTFLENTSTITFDLANELSVTSAKQGTTNLTFDQNGNNEIVVTLPTQANSGTSTTIEITYSGAPPVNGFAAFAAENHAGTPVMWTLSEPFGARDWWPCKQDLNDKMNSVDFYITAPAQYTSVANGLEQSAIANGDGTKTTHFFHNYPIPAYLVAFAVTNYQTFTQTAGIETPFPIVNYIYPENYSSATTQLAETLPIMNLFETLFEPYPFKNEKYGHAQFGWGGGMEHTTVSFMGSFGRSLIAHELGHQWFGDKITCGSWNDIWLNEGFAEYLSGLVVENLDGDDSFTAWKNTKINNITSQPSGAVYLTDTEATNVNRIFSSRLTYNKGSMVVNMLRFKLGDEAFFLGMRNYLADADLAYKYAVSTDLQEHLEIVYGGSLDEFFNDWLYNQGYPTYTIIAQNFGAGQAKITVNQTQSHPSVSFFEMPVPIRLLGAGGQTFDTVVNNTTNGQQFIVSVPFVVTGVQFDPKKNIISKNNTATLSNESFNFEDAIVVSPNPANDEIHIQMPLDLTLESVEIFNNLGQLISTKSTADFSVSNFSSGIHFLKIVTSEGTFHKKIIKN